MDHARKPLYGSLDVQVIVAIAFCPKMRATASPLTDRYRFLQAENRLRSLDLRHLPRS
jgi:hypothetical protein